MIDWLFARYTTDHETRPARKSPGLLGRTEHYVRYGTLRPQVNGLLSKIRRQ